METETLLLVTAAVVGWLTSAFGWFKWLHELREKRREMAEKVVEREKKEKAEAELAIIHRRALTTSPFFSPSNLRYNSICFETDTPMENVMLHPFSTCVLCGMCDEVRSDAKEGDFIYLLTDHTGCDALEIGIDLNGQPAAFCRGHWDGDNPVLAIRYAYHPESHGQEQAFRINFLSSSGARDSHLYKTRHGFRVLKRVDPT